MRFNIHFTTILDSTSQKCVFFFRVGEMAGVDGPGWKVLLLAFLATAAAFVVSEHFQIGNFYNNRILPLSF